MSISRQNLTVVIVTLKSDHVIDQCIQSIDGNISILVVENSQNQDFKNNIEKKYKNVSCILTNKNIGMGSGNNFGILNTKTDFVMILNPDVLLFNDTIDKLIEAGKLLKDFAILAPLSDNLKFPNYKTTFKDIDYFDENFFMYLENDYLCKMIKDNKEKIFVVQDSKIKHYGAKAVSDEFYNEVELSRNWHWSWSKFYYTKKHKGYIYALIEGLPKLFSSMIKYFFYLIINKKYKSKIYHKRTSGLYNAIIGKSSWYRPKLD